MNAGRTGAVGEIAEWVEVVDIDGRLVRIEARDIRFGYREADFPVRGIVARVGFRLAFVSTDQVFDRIKTFNERRRATQPLG